MLSAEWPKTSCIGKRRKRERKKERKEKKKKGRKKGKKEKKKRKKKKEREKRVGEANRNQKEKKKPGGVSSDSVYSKSLDFPWNLSV